MTMHKTIICITLLTSLALLAGCENTLVKKQPEPAPPPPPVEIKPVMPDPARYTECSDTCAEDQIDENLSYWVAQNNSLAFYQWLKNAIDKNANLIVKAMKDRHEQTPEDAGLNLYYALVLSYPDTKHRNTYRAIARLKTYMDNHTEPNSNNHQFAQFVQTSLLERSSMLSQRTKLREQVAKLEKDLTQEKGSSAETRKQLNQLKSIEKSLLEKQTQETKKYRVVK